MLNITLLFRSVLAIALPISLISCSSETTISDTNESEAKVLEGSGSAASEDVGALEIRANGEDFVRQGFVTKDGWRVDFDNVYVTLSEVGAYQSEYPFDAEAGGRPEAQTVVNINGPITIDLAEGDEIAEPILVKTLTAPIGHYNALSWTMKPATAGPSAGYSLMMRGQGTKGEETVLFSLKFEQMLSFICGDYVGDHRKGILAADDKADLEMTFHFDHLFGSGEVPADDDINVGALGFDPLAAIAEGGTLDVDVEGLKSQLSPADYDLLVSILPNLGHVGEGHCVETALTNR